MKDIIIIVVLLCIIAAVIWYIYKAKKSGAKCIGCPHGRECSGKCSSGCCSSNHKEQ